MNLQAPATVIALFGGSMLLALITSAALWSKKTQQQPHSPPLDWAEALFVSFISVVLVTGWVALIWASFGRFSLLAVSLSLLLVSGVIVGWQRPFQRITFAPPGKFEALLAVLLLGSALVYFRPHEYVLGGIDPGNYSNIAATLARTGDFIITDDWSATLRAYPETTLREQPPQWRTRYLQFVGWYLDDQTPDRVIPQFFPYHPTLMAVGVSVGGLLGGLLVTPLWSVLGLAAVYFLTRRLWSAPLALLATALLAITPTTIYFSRYPSTEPLTLLLVFTGLLAFQTIWDEPETAVPWGFLGGAAFGSAFLTRIDLPLVALLVVGWLLIVYWQKRWHLNWSLFAVTMGILAAHAGLSAFLLNGPYMWNTYGSVVNLLRRSWLLQVGFVFAGLGVMLGLGVMWRTGWASFQKSRVAQLLQTRSLRLSLGAGVVLLSVFTYFVRPIIQPGRSYLTWPAGTTAWALDGENWVRIGWYLTPLGLILATVGLAWVLQRVSFNRLGLFLSIGSLTILQYVYKIFNTPYHIYTMRRYVPIVLPMLLIYAAACLFWLYQTRPGWRSKAVAGLLIVGLAGGMVYQSRAVLPLREYRGAIDQLALLHAQIPDEAIIVINEPATAVLSDTFGPPLRFIYGHDIATIREPDAEFIDALKTIAAAEERPLILLAVEPLDPFWQDNLHLTPRAFVPIQLEHLMNTFTEFPTTRATAYYGLELYDVSFAETAVTAPSTQRFIDIGTLDTAYIRAGFYGKEPLPGPITMRWTSAQAEVSIPTENLNAALTIEVRARIFRPEGVPETAVTVWLNAQKVGQFTPTAEWQTYAFTTEFAVSAPKSQLLFQAETFSPAELQITGDTRQLGFLLDWVNVSPAN